MSASSDNRFLTSHGFGFLTSHEFEDYRSQTPDVKTMRSDLSATEERLHCVSFTNKTYRKTMRKRVPLQRNLIFIWVIFHPISSHIRKNLQILMFSHDSFLIQNNLAPVFKKTVLKKEFSVCLVPVVFNAFCGVGWGYEETWELKFPHSLEKYEWNCLLNYLVRR